jgi:PIN domain nuclease of toxin-antitoxin system
MNIIVDTHIFHWMLEKPEKLSSEALSFIEDTDNRLFLSSVSIWEFGLLFESNQKREFKTKLNVEEFISQGLYDANIDLLPITPRDALALTKLPSYHDDLFDKMILAQAISNDYPIISKDSNFPLYTSIRLIW